MTQTTTKTKTSKTLKHRSNRLSDEGYFDKKRYAKYVATVRKPTKAELERALFNDETN
jgi:hypothetical protein